MTLPVANVSPNLEYSSVEDLRKRGDGTLKSEKARLRKATQEFEAFFMYQMLKTMRQSTLEADKENSSGISGDLGKDEFTQMFDMELSRLMVTGGANSISELLYNSMVKMLEASDNTRVKNVELSPLHAPKQEHITIQREQIELPNPEDEKNKKIERPQEFLPISVITPKVKVDPVLRKFGHIIVKAARETNLDTALISAVIQAESGGNPDAISKQGAKGLMQLIDSTATEMGVTDVFDPADNIRGGSRYLRQMLDRFGDIKTALAAYNAGPGTVTRFGGIPPYPETEKYVERVMSQLRTMPHHTDTGNPKVR